MTHSDAGKYAAKHGGPCATPDEKIAAAVKGKVQKGELGCAEAEAIGAELSAPLSEVGRTLDLLEIRISRCQLGLFGYDTPGGRAVKPAEKVAPELETKIRARLADGKLPCKIAWEIAAGAGVPRMNVSSACEALGIRIKPCQLGAF